MPTHIKLRPATKAMIPNLRMILLLLIVNNCINKMIRANTIMIEPLKLQIMY